MIVMMNLPRFLTWQKFKIVVNFVISNFLCKNKIFEFLVIFDLNNGTSFKSYEQKKNEKTFQKNQNLDFSFIKSMLIYLILFEVIKLNASKQNQMKQKVK